MSYAKAPYPLIVKRVLYSPQCIIQFFERHFQVAIRIESIILLQRMAITRASFIQLVHLESIVELFVSGAARAISAEVIRFAAPTQSSARCHPATRRTLLDHVVAICLIKPRTLS